MSQTILYWNQFLNSLKNNPVPPLEHTGSFYFGGKEDASSIAKLVISGIKTATGSLLWGYEYENKSMPLVNEYNIITDSEGIPVCIIQTLTISIVPFEDVNEQFAFDCGEGDRTLVSWRTMYWEYILSECQRINRTPTPKIPLVCEYFKVVYDEPLAQPSI
nr:ASCH domain-containing protein [uncultured Chryseobacterium sp.]